MRSKLLVPLGLIAAAYAAARFFAGRFLRANDFAQEQDYGRKPSGEPEG